jgi:hypothetical protein
MLAVFLSTLSMKRTSSSLCREHWLAARLLIVDFTALVVITEISADGRSLAKCCQLVWRPPPKGLGPKSRL